jgi:transposase
MMGQHARSESLFYHFRIEDQVPENHLLRLIDRHISFDFVREKLKDSYSDTGRPSIYVKTVVVVFPLRNRSFDSFAVAANRI